ncbi:MAG TPA: cytochrome C oxidase subunit IV family protein [Thiobacillaceae bacterium]|nr:cytochrome C oxidase subunit IV family protein [Thiobacillaceae bacterium]
MGHVTFLWLLLLVLTVLSTQGPRLSETFLSTAAIVPLVLLFTLIKGRVVIDHFMGLQHSRSAWRWGVLAWLVLVLGLIAYAFHLPSS